MRKNYLIFQHDETDCGAASLASIAKYYGFNATLSYYRDLTKTDCNGTNINSIVYAAQKIGFNSDALSGSPDDLISSIDTGEISFPFIARIITEEGVFHFVVIEKYKKNKFYIADPAIGYYQSNRDNFFNIWTGEIIVFQKQITFIKTKKANPLLFISTTIKKQKKIILLLIFVSIVLTAMGIITAFLYEFIVNSIIYGDSELHEIEQTSQYISSFSIYLTNANYLFLTGAFAYIISMLLQIFRGAIFAIFTKKLDENMINNYYNDCLHLTMENINSRKTGDYISRFTDIELIRNAITNSSITIVLDGIMLLASAITMIIINVYLFFIALCVGLFYLVLILLFRKALERINTRLLISKAKVTTGFKETIDGIATIKTINAETPLMICQQKAIQNYTENEKKNIRVFTIKDALTTFVGAVGGILIFWIGSFLIKENSLTFGSLISYYLLLGYFLSPLERLAETQQTLQIAKTAIDRIEDIKTSKKELVNQEKIEFPNGDIIVKNLSFSYASNNLLLNNLSLTIKQGKTTAIIGESGSGKTTLGKLLVRFFDLQDGEILFNNINYKDIPIEILRKNVKYVAQDEFFFSGSILFNIDPNSNFSEEEIFVCGEIAHTNEFISLLPGEYGSMLVENGNNFSLGQKQRLALQRVLLQKPKVLILDEATTNLDSISEKSILVSIREAFPNITIIIISHKKGIVDDCDYVIRLHNGEMVDNLTIDDFFKTEYYSKMN